MHIHSLILLSVGWWEGTKIERVEISKCMFTHSFSVYRGASECNIFTLLSTRGDSCGELLEGEYVCVWGHGEENNGKNRKTQSLMEWVQIGRGHQRWGTEVMMRKLVKGTQGEIFLNHCASPAAAKPSPPVISDFSPICAAFFFCFLFCCMLKDFLGGEKSL